MCPKINCTFLRLSMKGILNKNTTFYFSQSSVTWRLQNQFTTTPVVMVQYNSGWLFFFFLVAKTPDTLYKENRKL